MIHATGSAIIGTNLTVSGILQSPMTSLIGVSSGIIDGKVGTFIGTSISQFLTRNETTIPTSFNSWGTTGTSRIINTDSNLMLNCNTANSYIQFRGNTQNTANGLIGLLTNDMIFRQPSLSSRFYFQDPIGQLLLNVDNAG